MKIAFTSDPDFVQVWDQLRDLYRLDGVYEVGGPPEDENTVTGWHVIESLDEITESVIVAFQPVDSPTFPGTIALSSFEHPAGEDVVYVFGDDMSHNPPFDCAAVVYVELPRAHALWSFQAAAIVLHDRFSRG